MDHTEKTSATASTLGPNFILGLWGVRYQVKDVKRSVEFYTQHLGLELDQQHLPAFAQVSMGHLVGPGGKQIQLEDPDGNPIELFEPAK